MKAFLLSILLMFSGSAMAFDSCMTGSWYEPATNGEGLNVEVLTNGKVVAYFYKSDEWFAMSGPSEDGLADLRMLSTRGPGTEAREVGSASVLVVDNNTIIFDWYVEFDFAKTGTGIPWCIGCYGTREMTRLTEVIPCN